MVKITQRFVPKKFADKVTFSGKNQNRTLTVHQTGNFSEGANAEMHARLQERGNSRNASWMFQSDDKEIIQSFPTSAQTWHAGDGNGDGNKHSISWEICVNRDGNYKKSLEVAAKGIAQVLKEHKLGVSDLRQHHDWSGKNCPQQIRAGKEGITWNVFKNMVQDELSGKPVKPQTSKPKPAPSTPSKHVGQTLHLPASAKTWRVYNPSGPYTTKHAIHQLTPSAFGGLAYEIKGNPAPDVYLIDTGVKGRVAIYAHTGIGASFSKKKPKPTKTIAQMADEIDAGKHGNGHANRQKSLGVDNATYAKVRAEVNKRAGVGVKKTSAQVANEIYLGVGDWGTGATRRRKLIRAGYNPTHVQNLVNKKF